jgi:hypothetical protein
MLQKNHRAVCGSVDAGAVAAFLPPDRGPTGVVAGRDAEVALAGRADGGVVTVAPDGFATAVHLGSLPPTLVTPPALGPARRQTVAREAGVPPERVGAVALGNWNRRARNHSLAEYGAGQS